MVGTARSSLVVLAKAFPWMRLKRAFVEVRDWLSYDFRAGTSPTLPKSAGHQTVRYSIIPPMLPLPTRAHGEAACGSPPSASAREIRVPHRFRAGHSLARRLAHPRSPRPPSRLGRSAFASKSAAAMMRHALSRADFAPAPARSVSTPPARLARRPTARVVPRAGGSSAPTLDEAFAALDARRVASGSETALPPFQSTPSSAAPASRRFFRARRRVKRIRVTPPPRRRCPAHRRAPTRANSRSWASRPRRARSRRPLSRRRPVSRFLRALPARRRFLWRSPSRRACSAARFPRSCSCVPTLRAIAAAADEIADLAASVREEVRGHARRRARLRFRADGLFGGRLGELTHDVGSGIKGTGKAVAYTVDTAAVLGKAAATQVRKAMPEVRRARERARRARARARARCASASVDDALRRSDETLP